VNGDAALLIELVANSTDEVVAQACLLRVKNVDDLLRIDNLNAGRRSFPVNHPSRQGKDWSDVNGSPHCAAEPLGETPGVVDCLLDPVSVGSPRPPNVGAIKPHSILFRSRFTDWFPACLCFNRE